MSVELIANCDECRIKLRDGDSVFCDACWEGIKKDHETEIAKLELTIEKLSIEIDALKEKEGD